MSGGEGEETGKVEREGHCEGDEEWVYIGTRICKTDDAERVFGGEQSTNGKERKLWKLRTKQRICMRGEKK